MKILRGSLLLFSQELVFPSST
uniref:Uncharacterized protein n=1 Tax=Rhizophora mucronata TaxID=61149 RepID=A0A2P2R007_RHIMU